MKTISQNIYVENLPISQKFSHIIHISDIHIRPLERQNEYKAVFQELYHSIQNLPCQKSSIIVVTGDILHNKLLLSTELLQLTADFFHQLDLLCPVIAILGNHDMNLQNSNRPHALTVIFTNQSKFTKPFKQTYLLEKSGVYLAGNCAFGLASIQDQFLPSPLPELHAGIQYRIALYHGGVGHYRLDNGMSCRSNIPLQTFNAYDYVLLGDIHQRQFLDASQKRIAYAGSLIQQNRMESYSHHGFLLWDLQGQNHRWVNIKNKLGGILNIYIKNGLILFHPRTLQINSAEFYRELNYELGDTPPPVNSQNNNFWELFKWDEIIERKNTHINVHLPPDTNNISKWHTHFAQFFHQTYEIPTYQTLVLKFYHDNLGQNPPQEIITTNDEVRDNGVNDDEQTESGENNTGIEPESMNDEILTIEAIQNQEIFIEYLSKTVPNNFSLPGGNSWNNDTKDKIIQKYHETIQWIQDNQVLQNQSQEYNDHHYTNRGTPLTPLKLLWNNLMCYDSGNSIDFTHMKEHHIFNISGKNFSGKSSIIDILIFALYGKTNRGGPRNVLGNTQQSGDVTLEFLFNQGKYKIYRKVKLGRRNVSGVEQSISLSTWNNETEQWDNNNDEGVLKTQKSIEDMIGPMKIYTEGPIFLQGQADEFFQLTPSERKNLLLKKLNFDVVDTINEHLRSHFNEKNNEIKINKTNIKNANIEAQKLQLNIQQYDNEVINENMLNPWELFPQCLLKLQSKQNEYQTIIESIQTEMNRIQNQLINMNEPHKPIQVPGNLTDCNNKIKQITEKLNYIVQYNIRHEEALKYLQKKLPGIQALHLRMKNENNQMNSKIIEKRVELQTIINQLGGNTKMVILAEKYGLRTKNDWERIIDKSQNEIDAKAPQLKELQSQLQDIKNKLNEFGEENVENEINQIETARMNVEKKNKLKAEFDKNQSFIQSFHDNQQVPHPECQYCAKNPTIAQYHLILHEQIPQLTAEIESVNLEINAYRTQRNKAICGLLKTSRELENEIDSMMSLVDEPYQMIEKAHKFIIKLNIEEEITELQSKQKLFFEKINELNIWIHTPTDRIPRWLNNVEYKEIIGELHEYKEFFLPARDTPNEVQRELDYELSKKELLERSINESESYHILLKEYQENVSKGRNELRQLEIKRNTIQQSLLQITNLVSQVQTWIQRYQTVSPEVLALLEEEVMYLNANSQIFSRHGFPFYLMQKIIHQIIGVMNNELSLLTDFHIRAHFDENEKKADKNDIHFFIIKHNTPDHEYDLNQGSGFERFISAILWRIHTARMYHPARIMPMSYIIFDESFHFWDSQQLNALDQLFSHLQRYAPNILIISHIPQVAEIATGHANVVRPPEGFSHLNIPTIDTVSPQVIEVSTHNTPIVNTNSNINTNVNTESNTNVKRTKTTTRAKNNNTGITNNNNSNNSKMALQEQARALGLPTQKMGKSKMIDMTIGELQESIQARIHQNLFS